MTEPAEARAPLNFKSATQKEKKDVAIKTVELSGSVAMKILQHCTEADNIGATGQLLGLDVASTLEVTECFPSLASEASEQYQLSKMRCLRDINVDSNTVGWYQSAPNNDMQSIQIIETFISYDESIKKCVCIVCDVKESQRGALALKALGLNRNFLTLYKKNPNLTAKELYENKLSWHDLFVEVPIRVANSPLIVALTAELAEHQILGAMETTRLRMNALPFIERQLERVGDGIDALHGEMQDISSFERARARQEQQKALWTARRAEENQARKQNGEELLPSEDPVQFKPIEPPSLVTSYLLQQQVAGTCGAANSAASELLHKLQVADCLRM